MASDRVTLQRRILNRILRMFVHGPIFRLYAPQSAPAPPSARKAIAICDLISNLGDKIMIFPILDALREENPDAEISYFTSGAGRVIGLHPAVDRLYVLDRTHVVDNRFNPAFSVFSILRWWRRDLRPLRFHTVVVLRGGVDPYHSHFLAWLLGGRTRVSYSPRLEPERPDDQHAVQTLFTASVDTIRDVHEVSRGVEVLHLAGLLQKKIDLTRPVRSLLDLADAPEAVAFLAQNGLDRRPYAIVSPGASVPRRAWPAENFAELARRVFLPRGWLPVIVGGPELAPLAQILHEILGPDALDLTGQTGLPQLAAVCAHARCFVGNDSGTAHAAGACGAPTLIVTAFARSGRVSHHASPARSHPVGPFVAWLQPEHQMPPCTSECLAAFPHCITQVTVDQMERALVSLLARAGSATN